MNYQNLTALDMAIAASLILVNGALSLLLRLGLGRQLLWAAVRTVVQLSAIGYLLGWVFAFAYWYVVLPLMGAMTLIAGLSAAGRGRRTYRGQRLRYLLSATTEEFAAHPRTDQARTASRGDWIRLYWKGY